MRLKTTQQRLKRATVATKQSQLNLATSAPKPLRARTGKSLAQPLSRKQVRKAVKSTIKRNSSLNAIKMEQKLSDESMTRCIAKAPMRAVVRELLAEIETDHSYKIGAGAMDALMAATLQFAVDFFAAANIVTTTSKRRMLMSRDLYCVASILRCYHFSVWGGKTEAMHKDVLHLMKSK